MVDADVKCTPLFGHFFGHLKGVFVNGRALALAPETRLATRLELLLARERVYDLQGAREAQVRDLEALEELADRLGAARERARVALRRSQYRLWCLPRRIAVSRRL
jgi:hypothetical protein